MRFMSFLYPVDAQLDINTGLCMHNSTCKQLWAASTCTTAFLIHSLAATSNLAP